MRICCSVMHSTLLRLRADPSGASAVEFAIVTPFLCLILFGIMYVGLFIGLAHSLEQISADAGRYAVVGMAEEERHLLAEDWVREQARSYPMLISDRLTTSTSEVGDVFTVTVHYDASALPRIPILDAIIQAPAQISRTSAYAIR